MLVALVACSGAPRSSRLAKAGDEHDDGAGLLARASTSLDLSGADESAAAKKKVMRECGIHVVDSPATIGAKVKEVLG